MPRMLVLAYGGRPTSHAQSITPQGGGRIHLCGVLYTTADQAVHSRGCGSGCEPGWRGIWAIGHVDVSRGVRAPKSEKGYTTPRSDFRFLLNRSQWRDRAGFAPASTSRMRAFYFRILFRHYQVGAPDDLSARCGSVRACACLSCPSVAPSSISLTVPAIGESSVSFPRSAGNDPRKTPLTISAFYATALFKRFFIGAPSIEVILPS